VRAYLHQEKGQQRKVPHTCKSWSPLASGEETGKTGREEKEKDRRREGGGKEGRGEEGSEKGSKEKRETSDLAMWTPGGIHFDHNVTGILDHLCVLRTHSELSAQKPQKDDKSSCAAFILCVPFHTHDSCIMRDTARSSTHVGYVTWYAI